MQSPELARSDSDATHEADLTRGMEHMRPYVSVKASTPKSAESPPEQESDVYGVPSSAINPTRRPAQRRQSPSNSQKRTDPFQFGSRLLEEGDDVFEFNAWDHVEVDEAFKDFAEEQYQRQRDAPVSDFDRNRINAQPAKPWNRFYSNNSSNFFKNRKWLFQEFPTLAAAVAAPPPTTLPNEAQPRNPVTILEIGAGAGNTAFPLLAANQNPHLKIHALDFSSAAVDVMRADPGYDERFIHADVWDLASAPSSYGESQPALQPSLPPSISPSSIDIAILVFTLSALAPPQWQQALLNVWTALKPGGEVLFRDYGHGDLAQVRFKKGRWMGENFYVRGDGTRVYFFGEEELRSIWEIGGKLESESKNERESESKNERESESKNECESESKNERESDSTSERERESENKGEKESERADEDISAETKRWPGQGHGQQENQTTKEIDRTKPKVSFEVLNLGTDRRMLVNRRRKLKMYRCWMQGRFRKPYE